MTVRAVAVVVLRAAPVLACLRGAGLEARRLRVVTRGARVAVTVTCTSTPDEAGDGYEDECGERRKKARTVHDGALLIEAR